MLTSPKWATAAPCSPLNYPWCCIDTSSACWCFQYFLGAHRPQCSPRMFSLNLFKLYNYFNFSNFSSLIDPNPSIAYLCNLSWKKGSSQDMSHGNMLLERLTAWWIIFATKHTSQLPHSECILSWNLRELETTVASQKIIPKTQTLRQHIVETTKENRISLTEQLLQAVTRSP